MSTITKEQAQSVSDLKAGYTLGHADVEILNDLARIALASLEAEAVGFIARHKETGKFGSYLHPKADWFKNDDYEVLSAYTAPPAPVSVPAAMEIDDDFDSAFEHGKAVGWNAYRAAMLQAEPVTTAYKLPDDFDFDRFNDVVWLETVASNPHMHSPTTSTIAMVALELNRKLAAGNSPVISDGGDTTPPYQGWVVTHGGKDYFYRKQSDAVTHLNAAIESGGGASLIAVIAEPVTTANKLPEETGSSLQLRNLIRQRHAEWSQSTFGDVGPVGPLKHLSKEALEAAAEPDDLSEWADMQFLLWDAQRRAGICDGEITAAMEEKLKVNMARQWPEPKDGEPRLHIKP